MISSHFAFHLGFDAGVLVMVAVGMSMILPSAPAAVGIFEGATLIALNVVQAARTRSALPYAVVLHLVNLIPFVVVGPRLAALQLAPSAYDGEARPSPP